MAAIIVLIACSLIVAGGFLMAFLFSVRKGQFDDTYTPSVRMLFDDEISATASNDGEILKNTESHNENQ